MCLTKIFYIKKKTQNLLLILMDKANTGPFYKTRYHRLDNIVDITTYVPRYFFNTPKYLLKV